MAMAMEMLMALAMATLTAMAMMMVTAKAMAYLRMMRTEIGGRWEVAACGRCLLAVGKSCNKEDDGEMALMLNRVMETLQQRDNLSACK
jgi:hypothetical protein